MKNKFLQALISFITLLTTSSGFAQKIELKLTKDQKYKVETTTKIQSTVTAMGQEMENNANNVSTTTYVVLNASNREIEIGSTVTKMVSSLQMMGQEMSYNSEKKDNSGPMAEAMEKLMNKEKKTTIDPFGKVIKEEAKEENAATDPMAMLGGSSDNSGISIVNKMVMNRYIKPNIIWTDSTEKDDGKMKSKTVLTFKVTEIKDGVATMSFNGNVTTAGTMEQQGMEMTMSGSNKIDGTLSVTLSNGIILNSNSTTSGNSTIELQGMSIPVVTNIVTVSKIIE